MATITNTSKEKWQLVGDTEIRQATAQHIADQATRAKSFAEKHTKSAFTHALALKAFLMTDTRSSVLNYGKGVSAYYIANRIADTTLGKAMVHTIGKVAGIAAGSAALVITRIQIGAQSANSQHVPSAKEILEKVVS